MGVVKNEYYENDGDTYMMMMLTSASCLSCEMTLFLMILVVFVLCTGFHVETIKKGKMQGK